ncbi:hypothetical protein [Corallococcus carmarthensis]|uniref:hypothetical protein n=1 Tax=Corallococcus carmarthensis TaxID=2316728 RepID=UPI00148D10EC|nr:hypothetical protein [Corallococcus carmarthensis]NOK17057.1 hypothetical protein [Corallococcus carmarthensis]
MSEDGFSTGPTGLMDKVSSPPLASSAARASTVFFHQLHQKCSEIIGQSLQGNGEQLQGRAYGFTVELNTWIRVLGSRLEARLFKSVLREAQYGLLCLAQGHYSHAFRSLRLMLELGLQAVFLSAHPVELREWLESKKDTVWGEIIDEERGVFSARFVRAFDFEMEAHRKHYLSLSKAIYRECSECVHGNVQKHIVLPEMLEFSAQAFELWHEKAEVVALILTFAVSVRYFKELSLRERSMLETLLLDRLGHLSEIRNRFDTSGGDS